MKLYQILVILPLLTIAQNKFGGVYRLIHPSDTFDIPQNYFFEKHFKINADYSFEYVIEEDTGGVNRSWRSKVIRGGCSIKNDTIIFSKEQRRRKDAFDIKYYTLYQNFEGVKIVLRNRNNEILHFRYCILDSLSLKNGTLQLSWQQISTAQENVLLKEITNQIVFILPKCDCNNLEYCGYLLNLRNIKSGTEIELTPTVITELELLFNQKQFLLKGNTLHEIPTSCSMPDDWTENYKRTE